jgi:hypothetical protein
MRFDDRQGKKLPQELLFGCGSVWYCGVGAAPRLLHFLSQTQLGCSNFQACQKGAKH